MKQISVITVMSSYELCPQATVLQYMPRLLLLLIEPLGLPQLEDAYELGVDCCLPGVDCCLLHQRPLTTSNQGWYHKTWQSRSEVWHMAGSFKQSGHHLWVQLRSYTLDLAVLTSLLIWVEFTFVPDSKTGSRRTSNMSFLSPVFLYD